MHGFNIIIQSIDNSAVSQTRLLFLGTRLCKNTVLHSTHSIATVFGTSTSSHFTQSTFALTQQQVSNTSQLSVLIAVTYIWIRWYNNGYRFVVWITRPVYQLLARFWQKFKIQPSLIDTYSGLFLLSFMCFVATSVKLLISYFMVIDLNSTVNTNHCDSINVAEHAVLGVTAGLCLLVFVVPLMVLQICSIYHLKIFQQYLT